MHVVSIRNTAISILLFLSMGIELYGQSIWRQWEDGPLSWSDFQGTYKESDTLDSKLHYELGFWRDKVKEGNVVTRVYKTRATMNMRRSWVLAGSETDLLLLYNQVIFNIVELHRRSLQSTLSFDNYYMNRRGFLEDWNAKCRREIEQFQSESRYGRDEEVVRQWEEQTSLQIEEIPLVMIPPYTVSKFGIGMNAGLGMTAFTGTLSDHFTPSANFTFGFDVEYQSTILYLNMLLGVNRVTSEFNENGFRWPQDTGTLMAAVDFSLGQSFIDDDYNKWTPFVGLGILEFTVPRQNREDESNRMVGYGLLMGLNYEYKFRRGVALAPSGNFAVRREQSVQNIRFRLSTAWTNFGNLKGFSINFSVGYSFQARNIKIEH